MSRRLVAAALLLPLLFCAPPGEAKKKEPAASPSASNDWKAVEKDISEQKLEAAAQKLEALRKKAQAEGRDEEWARALVREVQLRMGLHGYETAVRFLKEQPWPQSLLPRTALELYYARALTNYLQSYSWEINQREQVDTKGVVDLKAWTRDQIVAEAVRAYDQVWQKRAELGAKKIGAMSEYLSGNNYPERIRGTLRDAVSYLSVELLADSSLWKPEQSNEQYRIDFASLLQGQAARASTKLGDPAVHPLLQVGAILDDLEAWHAAEHQPEAALEARLERIRRLRDAFTGADEQKLLREHLAKLLSHDRSLEWWSMGQALLAEMWRGEDLVRAHDLAKEGVTAHPGSLGGQFCLSVQKQIEAADYSIEGMATDGAGQRSIAITHRNLGEVYFRAWELDLPQRLESARDYDLLFGYSELGKLVKSTRPSASWTVKLPATPDYRSHKTYVTPPMNKPGWYAVAASARSDFEVDHNRVMALNFIVSDLVMVTRSTDAGGVEVRVVMGKSGKPIGDAQVELWRYDWQKHHSKIDGKRTDSEGLATFGVPSGNGAHFVVAKAMGQMAIDPNHLYLSKPYVQGETNASLVYTDRSIYRPTQKLMWKAVAYHGRAEDGKYKVSPSMGMTVSLRDPNGQEVDKKEVTTNAYGSAAGEFVIPTGRLLGYWTVQTTWNGAADP
jgi:hypothetical protein